LPPPTILAEYNRVSPDLAERIVAMAEANQKHRHQLEATDLRQAFKLSRGGQRYGLIALTIFAGLAGYVAHLGYPEWAAAIVGANVAAVVGLFITGQLRSRTERQREQAAPAENGRPGG
jgi:uncharacterized membrane protein